MEARFGSGARYGRVSRAIAGVFFFCAAQQAAAVPLAHVELNNFGKSVYEGPTVASGSLTGPNGAVIEGAADFSASPATHLNLVSAPGGGLLGFASLDDTLTFHVAGGGSAQVPFSVAGNWTGTGTSVTVTFSLGLGNQFYQGHGYTTGYDDGTAESAAFTHTGDYMTGVIGSYLFHAVLNVVDGGVYGVGSGVKAQADGGDLAYIDDPLTIDLPAGVTFTSASGSTYSAAPEPSALWLSLCGGVVALAIRRKRAQT